MELPGIHCAAARHQPLNLGPLGLCLGSWICLKGLLASTQPPPLQIHFLIVSRANFMLIRWMLYWLPMFQGQRQKSGPRLFWTGRSLSPAMLASYLVFVHTYQFQFLHRVRLPSAPRPWLFPLTGYVSKGSQFGQTLGAFYCRRLVVTELLHERMSVEDRFSDSTEQQLSSSSSRLPNPGMVASPL